MEILKLTTAISLALFSATLNADLNLYHIDVNQSDSTLIIGPTGMTLMIDTGEEGQGDEICDAVKELGVTHIDALITTHYYQGHYGNFDDEFIAGLDPDDSNGSIVVSVEENGSFTVTVERIYGPF